MKLLNYMAKLKFSQFLELAARTKAPVSHSKFMKPADIYFFQMKDGGGYIVVGKLVHEFLQRYERPCTYDYCWFVAWVNGLDRPYVSVG